VKGALFCQETLSVSSDRFSHWYFEPVHCTRSEGCFLCLFLQRLVSPCRRFILMSSAKPFPYYDPPGFPRRRVSNRFPASYFLRERQWKFPRLTHAPDEWNNVFHPQGAAFSYSLLCIGGTYILRSMTSLRFGIPIWYIDPHSYPHCFLINWILNDSSLLMLSAYYVGTTTFSHDHFWLTSYS
jgi:hypothetical protein